MTNGSISVASSVMALIVDLLDKEQAHAMTHPPRTCAAFIELQTRLHSIQSGLAAATERELRGLVADIDSVLLHHGPHVDHVLRKALNGLKAVLLRG